MAKRIAQMLYSMGMGGVENFLMNIYRNIDREKYQFDFILQTNERSYFDDKIEKLGGRIFRIPRFERHPIEHIKELKKILKENEYIAFHRHTASSTVFVDLLVAKECGIKRRIVHSHNTSHNQKMLNSIFKKTLYSSATKHLACSKEAGKWLYGDRKFEVLNNAINCDKYEFNDDIRKKYRNEFKLDDSTIALCHIGRFNEQKNHRYLIKIFSELCRANKEYRLFLCGDGALKEEIENMCKQENIMDKVVFLGVRDDVNNVLQAMDIFLFPSLYEGLGIVLIEAQMTNLPSIVSSEIPKEAIYNDNVIQLEINDEDITKWCKEIKNVKIDNARRNMKNKELIMNYDVKSITNKLIEMYDGKENYESFNNNSDI